MKLDKEPVGSRRRSGRSVSSFRKTCHSRFRSHLLASQNRLEKSRTTNLGPFGEVIRATGPMAKANPFRFSTKYQDDETDLVYYGYRYLNTSTGRWVNRDPGGEVNAYAYVANATLGHFDFLGLWGRSVHYQKTKEWAASDLKMPYLGYEEIATQDDYTDTLWDPVWNFTDETWSWHFDRSNGGEDSRFKHTREELQKAKIACTAPLDDWVWAGIKMGRALHADQDWVAHGDFNRRKEAPYIADAPWLERFDYAHNKLTTVGGQSYKTVDDPAFDADGPDGRATFGVLKFAEITSVGDRLYWTTFHGGTQRIALTKRRTEDLLRQFMDYIRANAKPCGECRKAFLGSD